MHTIALMNQKGGVGKTSCTHHLAGAFALAGQRVLLIDADPQASLTQGFWGPEAVDHLDPAETIAAVFAGDRPFPSQLIRNSGWERIDLVPGSPAAALYNFPGPENTSENHQLCLRSFVNEVLAEGGHDLVLIDCPPNLYLASFAALVAADYLVVPMQPEDYGSQGIAAVRRSVDLVTSGPNPGLQILGFLLTMVARETIQGAFEATLRESYGELVLTTVVQRAPHFKEAIALRKPVTSYKPKGAAAVRIKELATELLDRMGRLDGANLDCLAEVV